MTKREFNENIINGTITDEMIEMARADIARMDATNEKRKNTLTPKQEANLELATLVYENLTDTPQTAQDIYALGIEGITSSNKASSLCRQLVATGRAVQSTISIKGAGPRKAYTRV